ncbi:T9SS type A sorting domain-containing protein [candidate division KSB1 bacterium]|nr:T9SS type A sorting domain-containing protein [candidate division KSB1 bacterium]
MVLKLSSKIMADLALTPLVVILLILNLNATAQQINIPRIEKMPNMPAPYEMRDWKQVAIGYDSLVFDRNATGQYLPLINMIPNTVNYPEHQSFSLHTVVGTPYPKSAEAINVLPAVIGATLAGIDKSDQHGENWALMCEEFFNKRPEENIYLNNPVYNSGQDFWYDTMPNIFFYQLNYLYPGTGDFEYQFRTVADRWLAAVEKMGGQAAPWRYAVVYYRGWEFSTMTGNTQGVLEPEAAGAIAWILYQAYVQLGDEKYRRGAEWCMEFLNQLKTNPAYELQLPYGAYIAARMNAELGTSYDIEKIVNWCFNVGPLRDWGVIVGKWGDYDCSGLVGEATGIDDYAFAMNGFEQVGALVPMTRHDSRFARAIGKWALNVANASRLFYPEFLPDRNQDSEEWSEQYDPHSYIAHEAMRQKAPFNSTISPYATGDAIAGGWGATNLALYGSSHVGILGGIIDTTNVEMILKLDLLATDYYHPPAYPTYLYYNPFSSAKLVDVNLDDAGYDLYDAISKSFLMQGVSGTVQIEIPADGVVMLVLAPAGGEVTYQLNKMLINDRVVDYSFGQAVDNYPPRIKGLAAPKDILRIAEETTFYCTAEDKDGDQLSYQWLVDGNFVGNGEPKLIWQAPDTPRLYEISCIVTDGNGGSAADSTQIEVTTKINHAPVIDAFYADRIKADLGSAVQLTCDATDEDGDTLAFVWSADAGVIKENGASAQWTAPQQTGYYIIRCEVQDGYGGVAADSAGIVVLDFANIGTGLPLVYLPLNDSAEDFSGFENHGTVHGATPASDRFGVENHAFQFDGENDFIAVANNSLLNFEDEITVSFWMKADQFFEWEMFPISHGSWENRWKLSILEGSHLLRWTVKTTDGIKDIDSGTELLADVFYHVVARYDGSVFDLYLNGELDSETTFSGKIMPTTIDVTVGQRLPNDTNYNFSGVIDDVRIYNYAVSEEEIQNLYHIESGVRKNITNQPKEFRLLPNYPNPFNAGTMISWQMPHSGRVRIDIYDVIGRRVCRVLDEQQNAGFHSLRWDGADEMGQSVSSGIYFCRITMGGWKAKLKMVMLR